MNNCEVLAKLIDVLHNTNFWNLLLAVMICVNIGQKVRAKWN